MHCHLQHVADFINERRSVLEIGKEDSRSLYWLGLQRLISAYAHIATASGSEAISTYISKGIGLATKVCIKWRSPSSRMTTCSYLWAVITAHSPSTIMESLISLVFGEVHNMWSVQGEILVALELLAAVAECAESLHRIQQARALPALYPSSDRVFSLVNHTLQDPGGRVSALKGLKSKMTVNWNYEWLQQPLRSSQTQGPAFKSCFSATLGLLLALRLALRNLQFTKKADRPSPFCTACQCLPSKSFHTGGLSLKSAALSCLRAWVALGSSGDANAMMSIGRLQAEQVW